MRRFNPGDLCIIKNSYFPENIGQEVTVVGYLAPNTIEKSPLGDIKYSDDQNWVKVISNNYFKIGIGNLTLGISIFSVKEGNFQERKLMKIGEKDPDIVKIEELSHG